MEYTTLGKTGLKVSVAGLGCGGHSRLGMSRGESEDYAAGIVKKALDLGITIIDTAEGYGTEDAVGKGITGWDRDSVVICTKKSPRAGGNRITPDELRAGVEASLSRLRTEAIDVFYLHGVREPDYSHVVEVLLPAMEAMRTEGKIRFLGLTEAFGGDTGHETLAVAGRDPYWDVFMVGFNLLNPSARERVFPLTRKSRIGTTIMFAVRRALSNPATLKELMSRLVEEGHEGLRDLDPDNPLGFLVDGGAAVSIPEAAYRFCRHEPGADVVLTGTGNPSHLEENIRSILGPPLPDPVAERLRSLFSGVDSVSGN